MTALGKDAFQWAQAQRENGEKIQFIVEALCEAMIAVAPEGTPLREQILERPYAQLAKILGRDASKFLDTKVPPEAGTADEGRGTEEAGGHLGHP